MKLLVISDTHGDIRNAQKVINKIADRISGVIHLGDCVYDAKEMAALNPTLEFHYVSGNCDYGNRAEHDKIIEICNVRILATHGHKYNVKLGLDRLTSIAQEMNVHAVLYGHTHKAVTLTHEGILLFNPGSISQPRNSPYETYGVIEITDSGLISGSIVELRGGVKFG